jgi:hypothetical protein
MSDEDRMRAEIMAMRERGDQITDEVDHLLSNLFIFLSRLGRGEGGGSVSYRDKHLTVKLTSL